MAGFRNGEPEGVIEDLPPIVRDRHMTARQNQMVRTSRAGHPRPSLGITSS
jgi:hypothetical protein